MGGTVAFDDASIIAFGQLPNSAGAYSIPIGNKTTASIKVNFNKVSAKTVNIGLAEVAVLGTLANATMPNSTGNSSTSFLWVNDIALLASAKASSSIAGSGPEKAIDGQLGGQNATGGDPTVEWITNGEGVGAWIELSWPSAVQISNILAYDRPSTVVSELTKRHSSTRLTIHVSPESDYRCYNKAEHWSNVFNWTPHTRWLGYFGQSAFQHHSNIFTLDSHFSFVINDKYWIERTGCAGLLCQQVGCPRA